MRQFLLLTAVCCLVLLPLCVGGKRVVFMPMPFTSHTNYHTNVARTLARQGHEVWLTMPDYIVNRRVLDTTNLTVIEYQTLRNFEEIAMAALAGNYFKGLPDDWDVFMSIGLQFCDTLLTNASFFQNVKELRPDLFVFDNLRFMNMMTIISYRLGVPFAFLGTFYDPYYQRIPLQPCNIPLIIFSYSHHMSFLQRVLTTVLHVFSSVVDGFSYKEAVSRYAPEMPFLTIDMLVARAEIWLVETDHILDYPRPSMPNVKLIGGTATGHSKPLPPHFKSFMDDAKEGVVIVSFGSYVLSPPEPITKNIISVLQDLPFKSVFRSNILSPNSKKILTSSWIPQNDLLAHPNTRVFVSHCGKNGQYEAVFHAVPVVCTPLSGDQFYNAERMREKGMAETVDLNTVSTHELHSTILKVATNTSYKQAITKASELFKIEFGVPVEKAAYWLDHVMKYGGSHLRSSGHEVPFLQFSCWDVYAFLLSFLLLILLISVCLVYVAFNCCRSKLKTKIE
ncbi:2-hydroxyacylsphingosine 1-beta-galactosyltransferase-like [Pomacea canaliculata]|uniref:2-hydroxyacylsphingosine 1-beta-galactosyltransferase-like n=1 Tax=Pomacea canaliculata TaxID=400727 RepID=UPI000D731740|nr:2-hydroxyacylsphingosine 1-beta-galactosyltransferase-like [Pomacea canaliculata]XP_025100136.1 2-hydroxyacylsphingosine 1-beta-galactosyltransferase-like [Pomacea canaliculata]XP_025100137.1 2-hydroxyacylsphingosine 1-beta-galactosyltransferase-like [Pomacea canaliculata]